MSIFTDASVFIGGFGNHGSSINSLIFMRRYEVTDFLGISNNIWLNGSFNEDQIPHIREFKAVASTH